MTTETTEKFQQNLTTLNYDAITTMTKIGRPPLYDKAW